MIKADGNRKALYDHVYLVETRNCERRLNPIAIRPQVAGDRIQWKDTARGTNVQFSKIDVTPDEKTIEITLHDGKGVIILNLLTLSAFNAKAKERVAGNPDFKSDKDLTDYYMSTNFEA